MMNLTSVAGLCLAAASMVSPALAQNSASRCKEATGKATWTLIPAPNDPLGRVLGPATGSLKAAVSAFLTSLTPTPSGAFAATSVEVWAAGAQDLLIFNGKATFTPIPGQPVGTVADDLTLTLAGGTGVYAGATGTLHVTGTGHNLFGPNAGPGKTYFEVNYRGTICTAD